jgi:putative PIN family toxin of toxin-antitoxin system
VRVVLDTNVLLAAFFTRGLCEALLEACLEADPCTIVLSEHILDEFVRHAEGKFRAPQRDVAGAVGLLRGQSEIVTPSPLPPDSCRDRSDLPILGTAIAGNATVLVTGDADLLILRHIRSIPIISPRSFYDGIR